MRCYGKYKDDRICDLCKETNGETYSGCLEKTNDIKKTKINLSLGDMPYKCPYRQECYDDWQKYWACKKRDYDSCKLTEECLKIVNDMEG
ncbi:hypothetical protein ACSW9O_15345 (plasmid) [Clostridium perfringens]